VSLSSTDGNTAIVGGNGDDGNKGAAWIYTRSGSVWTPKVKLVGPSTASAQQGISVALDGKGKTAIVGGWGDIGNHGAAWVWTLSNGLWIPQGDKLRCRKAAIGKPACGYSVALSIDGDWAITGGYADDGGIATSVGAAWAHISKDGVWRPERMQKLIGSMGAPSTRQGWSVALSGDGMTAIVGGPKDNGNSGAAWIFVR
jgi:hypothetical protein